MADQPTCPHGFPSPKSCIDCMETGPVEQPPTWRKVGALFCARHNGECVCGTPIRMGDFVQRWDRGDNETTYTEARCHP